MNFNIARQNPAPALLTLVAFAAALAFALQRGADAVATAGAVHTAIGSAGSAGAADVAAGFSLPGVWLTEFQAAYPVWSAVAAAVMMIVSGIAILRMTGKINPYPAKSSLAAPLYGMFTCCLIATEGYLAVIASSLLLVFCVIFFCKSFRNGYSFGTIFRASLLLGLMPFVHPPALMLVPALPLAAVLFRRTLRETVVAMAGLVFLPLTLCYVSWGMEAGFLTPLMQLWATFGENFSADMILGLPILTLAAAGGIVLLDIMAAILLASNFYSAGVRNGRLLVFYIGVLVLTLAALFLPGATHSTLALMAVPSALLVPVFFICIDQRPAALLYTVLLIAAGAGMWL